MLGKVENIVETTINRVMEKDETRNKWAGVNLNEVESRDTLNGSEKSSGACLSQREMKFMNDLTEYVTGGSNVYSTKTKWTNVDYSVVKTEPDMQDEDDVKLSEESERLKKNILICNNMAVLLRIMRKACKDAQELNNIVQSLFSINQKFRDGVQKDQESLFNSLAIMCDKQEDSTFWRLDMAYYISDKAQSHLQVSI